MVETSDPPSPPPRAASIGRPDARWCPGAVVGEYRLVRRLGVGGMGAVDLAEHVETGALRAIKSLPATADPGLALRFRREAQGQAQVDGHPHVARVHSAGQALGHHYLVMEHLPGGDLEQRLREGTWSATDVARLGVQLAGGLEHCHARGILHRDLKPANVLFDGPGRDARPVIVDFGLARAVASRSLTATGEVLGTPAFMAPEQALGLHDDIGPRTDVYGLGALLYRALCGRPPAEGRTLVDVLRAVVQRSPPPPGALVAGVPPTLERALLRALAKRPDDRFASAAAFAEALEVGPPATGRRLAPIALGLAALVAALGAGLGLALARSRVAGPAPAAPTPSPAPPAGPTPAAPPPAAPTTARRHPSTAELVPQPPPSLSASIMSEVPFPPGVEAAQVLIERAKAEKAPADDVRFCYAASVLAEAALDPTHPRADAWRDLGHLFRSGRGGLSRSPTEAARCYEAAAKLGDVESMHLFGNILVSGTDGRATDLAAARGWFLAVGDRRDSTAPNLDAALLGLVRVSLADEHVVTSAEALAALEQMSAIGPDARVTRGQLRARLGKLDDALSDLRSALDDSSVGGAAASQLVDVLRSAGRAAEADAAWKDLARRADEGSDAHRAAYAYQLLRGESPEAHRLAATLLEQVAAGAHPWHVRRARTELYKLVRREPGMPVSLARARALVLKEDDGAELLRSLTQP